MYRFMQKESQRHNDKGRAKTSLEKYNSHFIARFACERELETEQNCNILTPLLWPSALCLSRSPDAQSEARGISFLLSAGFLDHILSPTGHQWVSETTGGPEIPFSREWLSLPHLISDFSGPQLSDFLS